MTIFQRMNGWQRLWVLACFLYGIFMIGVVAITWPFPISEYSPTEADYSESAFNSENDIRRGFGQAPYTRAEFAAAVRSEQAARHAKFERKNAELPEKRVQLVLGAFILWLVGSVVVYSFGWMVAWVKKGFQPTSS